MKNGATSTSTQENTSVHIAGSCPCSSDHNPRRANFHWTHVRPGDDIVEVVAVEEVVPWMATSNHEGHHWLVVRIGTLFEQIAVQRCWRVVYWVPVVVPAKKGVLAMLSAIGHGRGEEFDVKEVVASQCAFHLFYHTSGTGTEKVAKIGMFFSNHQTAVCRLCHHIWRV